MAAGNAKIKYADRYQVQLEHSCLDDLVAEDHPVRLVVAYVEKMDMSKIYDKIVSRLGRGGAPAIDPKILMALWLQAMSDGIGSARRLDQMTEENIVYRWICGGVSVNYHTLSDFRTRHVKELDELLAMGVATMVEAGVVPLERLAIDGMRVRASAGTGSFRSRESLDKLCKEARRYVKTLRKELKEDPAAGTKRERAARNRAAQERLERLEDARRQVEEVEKGRSNRTKDKSRASQTDPDARIMKMGDGGYRPALNIDYATDTESQVIVGVRTLNTTDFGQLEPMLEKIRSQQRRTPREMLADGGFAKKTDMEAISRPPYNTTVYIPVRTPRNPDRDIHTPLSKDSEIIGKWRRRMKTKRAQKIYRERAATAECVNARARQQGLYHITVRGLLKAHGIALLSALSHNLRRYYALMGERAFERG